MVRGLRVLRYVVVAVTLLLVIYKVSNKDVDLSEYTKKFGNVNSLRGTTGGLHGGKADEDASAPAAAADNSSPAPAQPNPADGLAGTYERENATFVTLARNQDLWAVVGSIREVEDRFNHKYHYDWVFLNDAEFTEEFKTIVSSFVSGKAVFGHIPQEHWSYPDWIDQEKAALVREEMNEKKIIYGFSEPYRHMCRFESGFFWRNPALDAYKYYWRVEPHIKLFCDIEYDLFAFMQKNKKSYGFTISLYEYEATIETLWQTVKGFMKEYPQYIHPNNALDFISDDGGETYNLCHFWSNFEVGDLDFWRSDAYRAYFDYLDKAGGFFYERWGDAPVHSIAAALLMDRNEMHFFNDVGYWHVPFQNCPVDEETRRRLHCTCPSDDSLSPDQRNIFTWRGYSCTPRFHKVQGLERPKGWIEHTDK